MNTALPGTPENPLHTIKTIPNLITLMRLLLTIAFLFMYPHEETRVLGVIIFVIAASTDWFDGQVARKMHQVSLFGKRFDPVMDRILIFSGILGLAMAHLLPLWVIFFLIGRDIYLGCGILFLKLRYHTTLDVCYVGKVCTFMLMAGFAVLLFGWFVVPGLGLFDSPFFPGLGSEPASIAYLIIYLGCIFSFITALVYTTRAIRVIRMSRETKAAAPAEA